MLPPQHLKVLRQIAPLLNDKGMNWAITGSTGFVLQGVPLFPHDIDLQSDEAGAYEIERLLSAYRTRPIALREGEFARSHIGSFTIDGLEVEVMGELQKRNSEGKWSEPVQFAQQKHFVQVEELLLPVLRLEYEIEAYRLLGRQAKAQMLQDFVRARQKLAPTEQAIRIRPVMPDDAEAYLALMRQLDRETTFMLLEPDERASTVEELRTSFTRLSADNTQAMLFVAEHAGSLIGCLGATRGGPRRMAHTATIFIGILQAYAGKGIGTQLFIGAENWARHLHLHRLSLDVMTPNVAGIALYTRRGFVQEGVLKDAYYVDGKYVDAYTMAKLLN